MSVQEINKKDQPAVIQTDQLGRDYKYYNKEVGLKGSLKNLVHRKYLYKTAVNDLSITVNQGDIVGLIGLNGAGKTTTLKMLAGLLKPTRGNIAVLGFKPFDKKKEYLRQISMVMGSKSQLWWDLPAIETFELNRRIYEISTADYQNMLEKTVDMLEVKDLLHIQVRRLSLGERMKMEIILALLHNPKVVFLDEPTIGLDVISQYNIRKFLKEYIQTNHATVILTSHNFNDIVSLCDNLIILNKGESIYNETFESFRQRFSTEKMVEIRFHEDGIQYMQEIKDRYQDTVISESRHSIQLSITEGELQQILQHISQGGRMEFLEDIQIENISMDEIIRKIYDKKEIAI